MGKSSGSKAEVVEYSMSIHVGVGHELDAVTEIRVDEKVAWRGNVTTNTAIGINNPNLFGGQRKEGGLVGTVQVLMGREDQVLPAAAAARYRLAPNDCPAHRGVTTLMFHGSGAISTGRLGEWDNALADLLNLPGFPPSQPAYSSSGFLWKMNSPVIAQKIEVAGRRAPKGLDPATAMVGPDANPIHIIYECLVNDEWGMAGAAALIDKAGFEVEAVRLKDEGFGISLWWMRQQTIESFVTEILDHIQATIFVNPNTGLLSVKLLRDDYDIATLRHITPDNATLSNFKRRSSGEIVNEMTVSFTNPITEKAESITAQDIASIESQEGQKVAGSRDYYGIRNRELAGKVLARDLRASTAPLISAEAKLDRSAWDVLPGEVMLLTWPRRNANAVVVRAGKVSYGKPKDSAIRVSLMQDVFSLSKPAITIMPSTGWEDPTVDPQPLTMRLFTVPSFFARNAEMQGEVVALGPNEALVGALADSETYDSYDYELVSESVTANGDTVITSKGGKSMTPLAYLSTTMAAAATSVVPFALFPIAEETPRVGGFVFIGYGDSNQEVALVTGRTTTGWTIARGVLDTVPKTWAAGTPLWLINPGARIVDTQTIYAEGSTATYRGLDRTARGLLGYDDAPSISTVVTDRAHLPLRPANVRLNGVAFGSTAIGSASAVQLSWSIRNRLVEDSVVQLWTDSSVQPEYRQETVVSVYDATNDALLREYRWLWTETGVSFPRANLERYTALRFVVSSRRDDSLSLTSHVITVTGLAGNPLAADLPGEPSRTEPPSFYPAPGPTAFTATAGAILKAGSSTPTIEITGKQDIPEPRFLIARMRPVIYAAPPEDAPPDYDPVLIPVAWSLGRPVPINQEEVNFTERGLLGETKYEVQVAYMADDLIGQWRPLGLVETTPLLVDIAPDAPVLDDIRAEARAKAALLIKEALSRWNRDETDKRFSIQNVEYVSEQLAITRETLELADQDQFALLEVERVARIDGITAETTARQLQISGVEDALAIVDDFSRTTATALAAETEVRNTQVSTLGGSLALVDTKATTAVSTANAAAAATTALASEVDGVEATATLALSTSADLESQLGDASFAVEVAAGGDPAMIYARAKGSTSVAGMVASVLRFATSTGGAVVEAMRLVAGEVFFMQPIYIDVGSRRLIVGPGGAWVLWFGGNDKTAATATRTNGVFCLGTDGKVYYGATELGGGEPTPPGFKPSKSFARGGYAENTTEIVSIQTVGGSSTPSVRWTQKTFNYGTWTITSPNGVTTRFTNTSSSGERKDVFEWVAEDGTTTQSGVVTAYLPGI